MFFSTRPSSAAKAGADFVGLNVFPRSLLAWIVVPNQGELGAATTFGVLPRRSMSAAFTPVPEKNGPLSSSFFALVDPDSVKSPFLVPTATTTFDGMSSASRDCGQDGDHVARIQPAVETVPRADVVLVDEDIDVRARIAPLVEEAAVHLGMEARELPDHRADVAARELELRPPFAVRAQRGRDRDRHGRFAPFNAGSVGSAGRRRGKGLGSAIRRSISSIERGAPSDITMQPSSV